MYPAFVSSCLGFKVVYCRANRLEGLSLRTKTVMPVSGQEGFDLWQARRDRNMKRTHPLCREHRVSTFPHHREVDTAIMPASSITHVIVTLPFVHWNARHTDTGSRTAATSPIPGGCAVSFPDPDSVD
jgi:hypothetical protein